MNRITKILFIVSFIALLHGCKAPGNFATKYYAKHEKSLIKIEQSYRALYKEKPFSLQFSDKTFNYISLEMITDTLKYIYDFYLNEPALNDTLIKYGYNPKKISELINEMRTIKCTWINILDYFVNDARKSLVYISIRPKALAIPFNPKKYYILTFYSQPQYYDSEGRLLDNRTVKQLRRIQNEIFRRINDKVCYTISDNFR